MSDLLRENNLLQHAGDTYRSLSHLIEKVTAETSDDNQARELELQGENLMETFQSYLESLQSYSG